MPRGYDLNTNVWLVSGDRSTQLSTFSSDTPTVTHDHAVQMPQLVLMLVAHKTVTPGKNLYISLTVVQLLVCCSFQSSVNVLANFSGSAQKRRRSSRVKLAVRNQTHAKMLHFHGGCRESKDSFSSIFGCGFLVWEHYRRSTAPAKTIG